jgi:hypothetical protein
VNVADPLDTLARRVENEPFFLASTLALFARSEELDDESLCRFLRCPRESFAMLRLCRTPDEDPSAFQRDVKQIAERFGADVDALTDAVRRGQALQRLRQAAAASGTLLAARDAEEDPRP